MTIFTIEVTDQAQLDGLAMVTDEENARTASAANLGLKLPNAPAATPPTPITQEQYLQKIVLAACAGWAETKQRREFETAFASAKAGDTTAMVSLATATAAAVRSVEVQATPVAAPPVAAPVTTG